MVCQKKKTSEWAPIIISSLDARSLLDIEHDIVSNMK